MSHTDTSSADWDRPSQPGRTLEVEVAQGGEREDLEDGVERDQDRRGLPVTAGEVVPDQDHGDAPGEADDDQAGAVLRQVGQEQPGQGEHQRRADDPVEHDGGDQQRAVRGDVADLVVADLGQHRVHHHQQADGDRQGDRADLDLRQGVVQARDQAAQAAGRGPWPGRSTAAGTGRGWTAAAAPRRPRPVRRLVHGVAHARTPAPTVANRVSMALHRLGAGLVEDPHAALLPVEQPGRRAAPSGGG